MRNPESLGSDIIEGTLDVPGGKTAYRIYGASRPNPPLMPEPGGPGFASIDGDMTPYAGLSTLGNCPVILRDPVGCGKATLPNQDTIDYSHLWTIDRSARELASAAKQIQAKYGYEKMHFGGLSAGGIFLAEAVIRGYLPIESVQSFVLQSPMFDFPIFQQEAFRLLSEIDPDARLIIDEYETTGYGALQMIKDCIKHGDTTGNAYLAAKNVLEGNQRYNHLAEVFEQNHVLGAGLPVDKLPRGLVYSNEQFEKYGIHMFRSMVGPFRLSEVTPSEDGEFYDYSILADIHKLAERPTLIVVGEFDEITPKQGEIYQKNIPGSTLVVLKGRAHMAHYPARGFLGIIADHLQLANAT